MIRSKRIQLLAELAKRDEDKLAQNFQAAQSILLQEQQRLAELQDYYSSYAKMFANKTTHLRAQDIIQARSLLGRLADAQVAQKKQIDHAQQQLSDAQLLWQKSHLKRRSMDDLSLRYQTDEQKDRDQKEQKMMDEWISTARFER